MRGIDKDIIPCKILSSNDLWHHLQVGLCNMNMNTYKSLTNREPTLDTQKRKKSKKKV